MRDEILKIVGANIKKARKNAKIKLKDLSVLVNLHENSLYRIERGVHQSSLLLLCRLSHTLNVPINFFFKGIFLKNSGVFAQASIARNPEKNEVINDNEFSQSDR